MSQFAGSGEQGATDGIGLNSSFESPLGITINQQTGDLFVCDQGNHLIRKLTSQGTDVIIAVAIRYGPTNPVNRKRFYTCWIGRRLRRWYRKRSSIQLPKGGVV